MTRIKTSLILIIESIFGYISLSGALPLNCFFRKYLKIKCPGCGLTRSFRAILNLKLKEAISYNIIGIPLFIILIILTITLIVDLIKNTNKTLNNLNILLTKHYKLIITVLIITTIINNLNPYN